MIGGHRTLGTLVWNESRREPRKFILSRAKW